VGCRVYGSPGTLARLSPGPVGEPKGGGQLGGRLLGGGGGGGGRLGIWDPHALSHDTLVSEPTYLPQGSCHLTRTTDKFGRTTSVGQDPLELPHPDNSTAVTTYRGGRYATENIILTPGQRPTTRHPRFSPSGIPVRAFPLRHLGVHGRLDAKPRHGGHVVG